MDRYCGLKEKDVELCRQAAWVLSVYGGKKARDESVGVNRDPWETFTLQYVQQHFLKVPKVKLMCLIF